MQAQPGVKRQTQRTFFSWHRPDAREGRRCSAEAGGRNVAALPPRPRQLLPHGTAPSRPPCSLQAQARPGLLDAWIAEPRPGRARGGEEYLFHLVDRALPLRSPSLAVGCLCASVYDHAYRHGCQSQPQASHQAGEAQAAHGSCTLPREKAGGATSGITPKLIGLKLCVYYSCDLISLVAFFPQAKFR